MKASFLNTRYPILTRGSAEAHRDPAPRMGGYAIFQKVMTPEVRSSGFSVRYESLVSRDLLRMAGESGDTMRAWFPLMIGV